MTKNAKPTLNQQEKAIFAIGNLIISDSEKLTLWMIVWKIHQYLPLSQEESILWNSFEPKERNFLLTGDEVFSPKVPQVPNNLLKLTKNIEKVIQFQPNHPLPIQPNPHPPPIEDFEPDHIDWEETAAELDTEDPLNLHLSSDSNTPATPPPVQPKKRGRPKGSKNKPRQPPNDEDSIAKRTRSNPKRDDGPSCLQSSLFCSVSPHPSKWKPNFKPTAKQKQPSGGV